MNNFVFWSPTKFVFGRDTESRTGALAREFGGRKVLLVYGGGSVVRSGLLDRVKASLSASGIEWEEMGGIQPNPTDDRVYEGIELVRSRNIDMLIAVGGGSVIDTAKGIACGVPYEGDFWDFYCGKARIEEALPVGVVLTIPGAGSEGSGNSVITRTADGHNIKISLRTDSILRPRFAIMNPEMTYTLKARQTAIGVMDMMSHILERYFSNTTNVEVGDRLAEGLLMALMSEAPKAIADPTNYQARANIEWAGTLAHNGITGCGRQEDWASHSMEHEISALDPNIPHGAGLAVVFPAWMAFMAHHKPSKIAQLGRRIFDVDERDDRAAAIETVASFRAYISAVLRLPSNLEELGLENPDIDTMVERLHANKGEAIGGYYRLKADDTREIYRLMLSETQRQASEPSEE